ncbi:MAG TPA: OmpA family protein [Stellaceae bacterium]|jgi:outer membrane protein OmpA-like peptidoglycan-associated protein|nr:OmpA family protein [Stellaceae bacterium]
MKHTFKLLAVALLASASTAAMADPLVGPYVGVGVGTNKNMQTSPHIAGGPQWNYRWGISAEGSAGYSFGDMPALGGGGLRAEFEFGYRHSKVAHYKGAAAGNSGGSLRNLDYLVNAIYDFDQFSLPVIPHVGFGAGYSSVNLRSNSSGVFQHGFAPTIQGIVGIEYPIPSVQGLNVGLDYRYIETFKERVNVGAGSSRVSQGDHNFLLTARYTFAAPPAPPPAPAPAPVAAPAPAPEAQRAFQVFFDFDKSNITAEAAATIQKAAATVQAGHVATINVTGHTDTVGSVKYNLALSQRRAEAVKRQLVADGISASEIATTGVGKSGLLVPTPDGVREPQNRRAEIVLQ